MRTTFFIPALADRTALSAVCCPVPAPLLVEQELSSWRAVRGVRVDAGRGVACVEHDGSLDPRTVAEALHDLGLPVAAWTAASATPDLHCRP